MAFVIVKRAATFVEAENEEVPPSKELRQVIKNTTVVHPVEGDIPQEVPDWAENDDLYKIGVEEGWIVEVSEASAKAQIKRQEEADAKDAKDKKPVGLPQHTQHPAGFKR